MKQHNLNSAHNTAWVIKSRTIKWAEHATGMREIINAILVGKVKREDHFRDTSLNGRIILKMKIQRL
jgi:hypothetical protein